MAQHSLDQDTCRETPMSWVVAMIFWLQLLIAVVLYASVALAPKLMIYSELADKSVRSQAQLVHLEGQVIELKKVVESLENDPQAINELARIDLNAARPGEERIALDPDLILQSRLTSPYRLEAEVTRAWYAPFLNSFASNRELRLTCLSVSAALVMVAFTFFHTSQIHGFSFGWSNLTAGTRQFFARYRGRTR